MYNVFVVSIENVVGKPVVDQNFFGREVELRDLQAITEHEHVLLLAPRRVGKTSLLHALAKRVERDDSAIGVYASVAAATNEHEFVSAILSSVYATTQGKGLQRGLMARILGLGRGVKGFHVAGSGVDLETRTPRWQDDADQAFAALLRSERPLLILVDELPLLVLALARSDSTGARVRSFLQWFRNVRQLPAGVATLRFVLAGSIGLDNVTRRHRLTDTVNDLRLWSLGPFEASAADEFLRKLSASYQLQLDGRLRAAICQAAEWLIPYHLQVIFSVLREHAGTAKLTSQVLDDVIEALLDRQAYFSYWDERLHDSFGAPADAIARAVLATCAQDPDGSTTSTLNQAIASFVAEPVERSRLLKWVIDVLSNDGYIVDTRGRWRFRSGLLRRYWVRHLV
jgi:hypothetical protein